MYCEVMIHQNEPLEIYFGKKSIQEACEYIFIALRD